MVTPSVDTNQQQNDFLCEKMTPPVRRPTKNCIILSEKVTRDRLVSDTGLLGIGKISKIVMMVSKNGCW